ALRSGRLPAPRSPPTPCLPSPAREPVQPGQALFPALVAPYGYRESGPPPDQAPTAPAPDDPPGAPPDSARHPAPAHHCYGPAPSPPEYSELHAPLESPVPPADH